MILTNPRVGVSMSDLEARARRGCPWAQAELTKQSMGFAEHMIDDVKAGADRHEQLKELKILK